MIDDPMCRSTEATAFDIDKRFPERVSMHTIKQQGIPRSNYGIVIRIIFQDLKRAMAYRNSI